MNALQHGLTAKLPVLPFENPEEFAALQAGFVADFAPQNTYQLFLAQQLATHAWRILRSQQVEIGLQELLLKQTLHDLEANGHSTAKALQERPYAGLALTLQPLEDDPGNHLLRNLFRYTTDIQAQFHRTRKALAESLKNPSPAPPVQPEKSPKPKKPIESITPGFVSSAAAAAPQPSAVAVVLKSKEDFAADHGRPQPHSDPRPPIDSQPPGL